MASGYGKKSFKQKASDGVQSIRSFFLKAAAVTTIVGGPVYWNYGTFNEQEYKLMACKDNTSSTYEGDKYVTKGNYRIETDKGSLLIEKTRLHFQSQEESKLIYDGICSNGPKYYDNTDYTERNRVFTLKTYGKQLTGSWKPNIVAATEVPPEELMRRAAEAKKKAEAEKARAEAAEKARQAAAEKAKQQQQAAPQQPGATPQNGGSQQVVVQGGLSGRVQTIDIVYDGRLVIQLTVPVEAAGKVTIQSVTPLQSAPRPPGP